MSAGFDLIFASNSHPIVLPKKFLNKTQVPAVFMIEGRRVVAREAIQDGLNIERDRVENKDAGCPTSRRCCETWESALEALVREHSRMVYRIAYSVLRRHHDAEDATQETFMRVLRYSSKLARVDDPKTWLARIAWRVAVDRSKKRGWDRETPLESTDKPLAEVASSDSPADETVHGSQFGAVLEKLIAALPSKLREPLILSTIEEMSPRDVAATLGINEAAVRSRIFRARKILKEKLADRASRK